MSSTARVMVTKRCDDRATACHGGVRGLTEVFEAPFEAAFGLQDAPWAWMANNALLALRQGDGPGQGVTCPSGFARELRAPQSTHTDDSRPRRIEVLEQHFLARGSGGNQSAPHLRRACARQEADPSRR